MFIIYQSYNDGILHKGFHYKDGSYQYLGRKRRSLSANSSNYYGLPYQIYSATSGYQFKKYICNFFQFSLFANRF